MADLRVSAIHATIELSVKNDADANTGPDGHVDQALLVLSCAPCCLGEGRSIGVVLHRHAHCRKCERGRRPGFYRAKPERN